MLSCFVALTTGYIFPNWARDVEVPDVGECISSQMPGRCIGICGPAGAYEATVANVAAGEG